MKSLICKQPGSLKYLETILPDLQPGYAIILIKNVGICGTDVHAFAGTQPYFTYPRVFGHEVSGQLVKTNRPTSS